MSVQRKATLSNAAKAAAAAAAQSVKNSLGSLKEGEATPSKPAAEPSADPELDRIRKGSFASTASSRPRIKSISNRKPTSSLEGESGLEGSSAAPHLTLEVVLDESTVDEETPEPGADAAATAPSQRLSLLGTPEGESTDDVEGPTAAPIVAPSEPAAAVGEESLAASADERDAREAERAAELAAQELARRLEEERAEEAAERAAEKALQAIAEEEAAQNAAALAVANPAADPAVLAPEAREPASSPLVDAGAPAVEETTSAAAQEAKAEESKAEEAPPVSISAQSFKDATSETEVQHASAPSPASQQGSQSTAASTEQQPAPVQKATSKSLMDRLTVKSNVNIELTPEQIARYKRLGLLDDETEEEKRLRQMEQHSKIYKALNPERLVSEDKTSKQVWPNGAERVGRSANGLWRVECLQVCLHSLSFDICSSRQQTIINTGVGKRTYAEMAHLLKSEGMDGEEYEEELEGEYEDACMQEDENSEDEAAEVQAEQSENCCVQIVLRHFLSA